MVTFLSINQIQYSEIFTDEDKCVFVYQIIVPLFDVLYKCLSIPMISVLDILGSQVIGLPALSTNWTNDEMFIICVAARCVDKPGITWNVQDQSWLNNKLELNPLHICPPYISYSCVIPTNNGLTAYKVPEGHWFLNWVHGMREKERVSERMGKICSLPPALFTSGLDVFHISTLLRSIPG